MLKEIFEQPRAVADTLEGRIANGRILPNIFGVNSDALLDRVRHVQIIACGTSYHAGLVARYWLEGLAGIPCSIEVASEYRYRQAVVPAPSGTRYFDVKDLLAGASWDELLDELKGKQRGYL